MATVSRALLSLTVAGTLSLLAACGNGPEAQTGRKTSNASQQGSGSAEELVIIGLLAVKSSRQWSDNPLAPYPFEHENSRTTTEMSNDPKRSTSKTVLRH
jgi:hypothetical protein